MPNAPSSTASPHATPPDPSHAPQQAMVNLARMYVAGLTAAATTLGDWTHLLAVSSQEVGASLIGLAERRTTMQDAAAALAGASQRYLAGMTNLPRAYGLRFYAELQRLDAEARPADARR